jgi:hypothetical protein
MDLRHPTTEEGLVILDDDQTHRGIANGAQEPIASGRLPFRTVGVNAHVREHERTHLNQRRHVGEGCGTQDGAHQTVSLGDHERHLPRPSGTTAHRHNRADSGRCGRPRAHATRGCAGGSEPSQHVHHEVRRSSVTSARSAPEFAGRHAGAKPERFSHLRRSLRPRATASGSWASLPNVIAVPPSSHHQRRIAACSGTLVLTSRARPEAAVACSA